MLPSAILSVPTLIVFPVPTPEDASVPLPLNVSVSAPTVPVKLRSAELAVIVAS